MAKEALSVVSRVPLSVLANDNSHRGSLCEKASQRETLLGIVIWVMAVTAVVGIVKGLNRFGQEMFNFDAGVFRVSHNLMLITKIVEYSEVRRRMNCRLDDHEYFRDICRNCVVVGAQLSDSWAPAKYGVDYLLDCCISGRLAGKCL